MFTASRNIICVQFSKTSVFCALAVITGKKVDIVSIDSIDFEDGILVEGIVYDKPHLEEITKNLVRSVLKNHSTVDAVWISVPDSKVLISKFDVSKTKRGIDDNSLNRAIEEKLNFSSSNFYLINKPIHELNQKVFFLSYAIRKDHMNPFLEIFDSIGLKIESAFPTFQCIYQNLGDYIKSPTLVLFPNEYGYKFFLADANGVHLESVWGHNIIELNENFDKAINEIIQYAKQTKEIALGVKRILIVESNHINDDTVQNYLTRLGVEYVWIPSGVDPGSEFQETAILTLKGLIQNSMSASLKGGFLDGFEHNTDQDPEQIEPSYSSKSQNLLKNHSSVTESTPSYITPVTKGTVEKDSKSLQNKWNVKVLVTTVFLILIVLGGLVYLGVRLTSDNTSNEEPSQTATVTPSPSTSPTPTVEATPEPTAEASPTLTEASTTPTTTSPSVSPTPSSIPKSEFTVKVFNANNRSGEAARITGILRNEEYTLDTPENFSTRDIPSTSIEYNDPKLIKHAQTIAEILTESGYSSAKAVLNSDVENDVRVILGAR